MNPEIKQIKKLVMVCCMIMICLGGIYSKSIAIAASKYADVEMMYTSDLHGQLLPVDYITGDLYPLGSLAKVSTVVKKEQKAVGASNFFLFDDGDALYDYTTDYIYNVDNKAVQPIYKAMAQLPYDAITLGNHEFDYGLSYIKNQIQKAGLSNKCVVSNVMDSNTKEHVWNENKIIERSVKTTAGDTVQIKIGVIGETIPVLSKKRADYTGVLETDDIVKNVTDEAKKLKEKGADVVVALVHSGIGGEKPEYKSENVGYALTKISDVDIVLCGHLHTDFPGKGNTRYNKLPGVDTTTGLVNGKNLMQLKNNGNSIGKILLSFKVDDGKVEIVNRKTEICHVDDRVKTDASIDTSFYGKWEKSFLDDRQEILSKIKSGQGLQNYFGTLNNTSAIQLLNDIKISAGLKYKNIDKTKYKGYPVVAASTYIKSGIDDGNDYVDVRNQFTKADIYDFINYKTGMYYYKVTGEQLRNWMEWSARIYETQNDNIWTFNSKQESTTLNSLVKDSKLKDQLVFNEKKKLNGLLNRDGQVTDSISNYLSPKSLQLCVENQFLTNWKSFYSFGGVEYTIDTSVKPRYDNEGNLVNNTNRIKNLTINGKKIEDKTKILVVGQKLDANPVTNGIIAGKIKSTSTEFFRNYIKNYIYQYGLAQKLSGIPNQNWNVEFSDDNNYLYKTGVGSAIYSAEQLWDIQEKDEDNKYKYYQIDFSEEKNVGNENSISEGNSDKSEQIETTTGAAVSSTDVVTGSSVKCSATGPAIVYSVLDTKQTNKSVRVAIQSTAKASVSRICVLKGKYDYDSQQWINATKLNGAIFNCKDNGVYSIYSEDKEKNATVCYFMINNINHGILEAPKVEEFSNADNRLKGKAEANTLLHVQISGGKHYKTKIGKSGKFSFKMPRQASGKKIFVYVTNSKKRSSAKVVVFVKRVGPNAPYFKRPKTNSKVVEGKLNDQYVYPVLLVDKKIIYLPSKSVQELYRASKLYNKKYKVVVMPFAMKKNGSFSVNMPNYLKGKTKVCLWTLDAISRKSVCCSTSVQQVVPNKPVVYDQARNVTSSIRIYTKEKCSCAIVRSGGRKFFSRKYRYDSNKKMYYFSVKYAKMDSKYSLRIVLKNVKGYSKSITVKRKKYVPDTPHIYRVKHGKKRKVKGRVQIVGVNGKKTVKNTKTRVYVYVRGKRYRAKVSGSGKFSVKVKKIKRGTKIKCIAYNLHGKSLKAYRRAW